MEQLEVKEFSLHQINLNSSEPVQSAKKTQAKTSDLQSYAISILQDLLESGRARNFNFISMNELVASTLRSICEGGDWSENAHKIATKLFEVEKHAQEKVKQQKHF